MEAEVDAASDVTTRANAWTPRLLAIGLGSSMGDRRRALDRALAMLARTPGMRLIRASRWYRSAPMRGGAAVGWFLNGVAVFETTLAPAAVLARCQALESSAGRRRARWWGDRPLDLDLLVFDGVISDAPALRLPHPGIGDRAFVWWPLLEAWPALAPWLRSLGTPPARFAATPVAVARVAGSRAGAVAPRTAAEPDARRASPSPARTGVAGRGPR